MERMRTMTRVPADRVRSLDVTGRGASRCSSLALLGRQHRRHQGRPAGRAAPPPGLDALRASAGSHRRLGVVASGASADFTVDPGEWRPLWSLGLLFAAQIGLMNVRHRLTSAAHGAILLNLFAVHTVVLAHFLIPGDRLTRGRSAGAAIAYAGDRRSSSPATAPPSRRLAPRRRRSCSSSALLLAERIVYLARAVQRLDPVKLLLSQSAIGSACFSSSSACAWSRRDPFRWTLPLAGSLAYQGVAGRRLQLRGEPLAAPALPAERPGRHLPHQPDLRASSWHRPWSATRSPGRATLQRPRRGWRRGRGVEVAEDRRRAATSSAAARLTLGRPRRYTRRHADPVRRSGSRWCRIRTRTATTRSRWRCRSSPASAPMTGQPDFATIRIRYVPDQHLVELKSLKLYIWVLPRRGRLPRGRDQPHPRRFRGGRPPRAGSRWWATSTCAAASRRSSGRATDTVRRTPRSVGYARSTTLDRRSGGWRRQRGAPGCGIGSTAQPEQECAARPPNQGGATTPAGQRCPQGLLAAPGPGRPAPPRPAARILRTSARRRVRSIPNASTVERPLTLPSLPRGERDRGGGVRRRARGAPSRPASRGRRARSRGPAGAPRTPARRWPWRRGSRSA